MAMLAGKVALVTGGASGIGEATAYRFAEEGASVIVADIAMSDAQKVAEGIHSQGGEALGVCCDVTNLESVQRAFQAAQQRFGRVDIVFANAGIAGVWAPIEEMQPSEWERTLRTNLEGAFLTVHCAIPCLKGAGGGSVIITSSISGNRTFGQSGASAYSTSKAGLVAFMKMAALELARYGIRVNAVCPGGVPTNIQKTMSERHLEEIPLSVEFPEGNPALHGGIGSPRDIADVCLFLASDLSRHVSGVEIYADGGASLLI